MYSLPRLHLCTYLILSPPSHLWTPLLHEPLSLRRPVVLVSFPSVCTCVLSPPVLHLCTPLLVVPVCTCVLSPPLHSVTLSSVCTLDSSVLTPHLLRLYNLGVLASPSDTCVLSLPRLHCSTLLPPAAPVYSLTPSAPVYLSPSVLHTVDSLLLTPSLLRLHL
uniref:Uncharacterized protein n=1 Tax=Knipowitschia caucasica TaxID=637954 RepID=A0AAV2JLX3_KNICA